MDRPRREGSVPEIALPARLVRDVTACFQLDKCARELHMIDYVCDEVRNVRCRATAPNGYEKTTRQPIAAR